MSLAIQVYILSLPILDSIHHFRKIFHFSETIPGKSGSACREKKMDQVGSGGAEENLG